MISIVIRLTTPDFNYYGIDIAEVAEKLRSDPNYESSDDEFTWSKMFAWNLDTNSYQYERSILWFFQRMVGQTAFDENGDPLSIYNAPGLCSEAKRHTLVVLPRGSKEAPADVRIRELKKLLIDNAIFNGKVFDAYDDTLGDRKEEIQANHGYTLTLTCIKDTTGANIPRWGSLIWLAPTTQSLTFFEQANGRVGRKSQDKTNAGVFKADLESTMLVQLTIAEKLSLERDEDYSTRYICEELCKNYNYFVGQNGAWQEIDAPSFVDTLLELDTKSQQGINSCIRTSEAQADFDLVVKVTTKVGTNITINTNGTLGKNSRREMIEQMGMEYDDKYSAQENWQKIKLKFLSATCQIAFVNELETLQEVTREVEKALMADDQSVLSIVGKGVEWYPIIMTDDHIDIRYTNRWLLKMLGRMANLDDYYDTFGDPMFDKGTSFVKINKSAVEPLMAMAEL